MRHDGNADTTAIGLLSPSQCILLSPNFYFVLDEFLIMAKPTIRHRQVAEHLRYQD